MNILQELSKQLNITLEFNDDTKVAHLVSKDAFMRAKSEGKSPKQVADEIVAGLKLDENVVKKVEVAGAGFINIFLTDKFLISSLTTPGVVQTTPGVVSKVVFEYTDPNPFKVFHIGHLMPNLVGQAFSNIFEYLGADVKRVNYQGDVGLHVAKSVYGVIKLGGLEQVKGKSLDVRTKFLGQAYVLGTNDYESDKNAKTEIININKAVYKVAQDNLLAPEYQKEKLKFGDVDASIDLEMIKDIYLTGRAWSLEKFDEIYERLGTNFDSYYFESTAGEVGSKVVMKGLEKSVFEKSDGAIVFKGEQYGLHTRVFINSAGLPTYEAKDLGLPTIKQKDFDYDLSVIVTGNEIDDYFKVVLKALSLINPDLSSKTKHISHGMLKLTTGKMSSRKGNVITGEELMDMVVNKIEEIISTRQDLSEAEKLQIKEQVGLSAIKYMVLKPTTGSDIVFDLEESVKYDGNSGPYLQYTVVRANSILKKLTGTYDTEKSDLLDIESELILKLIQFNGVILRCADNYSVHFLSNYLYQLASSFNGYYGQVKIDEGVNTKSYRVQLVKRVSETLTLGLGLLGIQVPTKM